MSHDPSDHNNECPILFWDSVQSPGFPRALIFDHALAHKNIVIRARMQHMCDDLEGDFLL